MRHSKTKKIYTVNEISNAVVRRSVVEDDIVARLDKYLGDRFSYYSRNKWQELISSGLVLLNGLTTKYTRYIKKGDEIKYHLIDLKEPPVSKNIKIIYDDNDLIVVNKPADLPVIPSGKYFHNTLHSILSKKLGESLKMLNRIDRETSGCVVISRTSKMANMFSTMLRQNKIKKYYIALVENASDIPNRFIVEGYIKEIGSEHYRRYQVLEREGDENSKYSKTAFKLIKKIGDDYALLLCRLYTGRMHQIRVHLHSRGYFLLGDKVYGREGAKLFQDFVSSDSYRKSPDNINFTRQALHAYKMIFNHPITGKLLSLKAKIPKDIKRFIDNKKV